MRRGAEWKHAWRFAHIAANAPRPLFEDEVMYFLMPAVDGNIQTTGCRFSPEMTGTGYFQRHTPARSDLGCLREEMGARNLLILIKEVFPYLTEIVFESAVVILGE